MKNIIRIFIMAALAAAATACDGSKKPHKDQAQGTSYELILVCDNDKWEGELGDTLRSVLLQPIEGINQQEPLYDVLRIIPGSFNNMLQKNRNIIIVQTRDELQNVSISAQYDVYAAPQIIVYILGPDNRSVTDYVSEHRAELQNVFEIAERERSVEHYKRYGEKMIEEEVKKLYGLDMNLPKGYKVRNTLADKNFMWISFEYPTASQGVVIYSYPYQGREDFTPERLVERRNEFTALIPGENPGSHMTTYTEVLPDMAHLRINGRYWAEMRGFWDVKNDFMGGPFVSYSTLDTENRRVVTLDFYVYSPDKPKRNFLRGLEHIIYTVKFPGDEQIAEGDGEAEE